METTSGMECDHCSQQFQYRTAAETRIEAVDDVMASVAETPAAQSCSCSKHAAKSSRRFKRTATEHAGAITATRRFYSTE